jgi:DNA-binding LacI/PurR family transcriptional regulator
MKEKRVTLKDIASKCGLAVSTVSNILNDHKDSFASERVKTMVKESAERLGYKKDFLSVSLRTKRTFSIGLCMDEVGNETRRFFIKTFVRLFNEQGYEVALQGHSFSPQKALESLHFFEERYKDGIVMFLDFLRPKDQMTEALGLALQQSRCKVLGVGSGFKSRLPCLDIDRSWAFREGLAMLRRLGHRKILLVYKSHFDYREAFSDMQTDDLVHMSGIEKPDQFVEHWDKCKQSHPDISAIFFRTDEVGVKAMVWLQRERAFVIPQDLCILSFDNFSFGDYSTPRISTFDINMSRLGEECYNIMYKWIERDCEPEVSSYQVVKPVYIERETLAAPFLSV